MRGPHHLDGREKHLIAARLDGAGKHAHIAELILEPAHAGVYVHDLVVIPAANLDHAARSKVVGAFRSRASADAGNEGFDEH